jgi:hypothetical protein
MLRISHNGTTIELSDEDAKKVYSVAELVARLKMSPRRTYDLLKGGEIDYCCGAKKYRVGEPAVVRFLLGYKPLAA